MRRWLDFWATVYRNTRALTAAVLIWAAVLLMWGLKCQADRDPVVRIDDEDGIMVQILGGGSPGDSESGLTLRRAVIMLSDSTTIDLIVQPPWPRAGDRVPLRTEVHRSGKRVYLFDQQRWRMHGPG